MFKTLSFNVKLWLTLAMVWVGLFAVGIGSAVDAHDRLFEERLSAIDHVLDVASNIAAKHQERVTKGELTEDEAKKLVLEQWGQLKFRDSGYVYAATMNQVLLLNPGKPEQVGKDMSEAKDAKGNRPYQLISAVAKEKGRGFISAFDKDPKTGRFIEKISAVHFVPKWNWAVAARLYVDDVNQAFQKILLVQFLWVLATGAVATVLMVLIIRSINKSLGGDPAYAAEVANRIAMGDLTVEVNAKGSHQGSLLFAMKEMAMSLAGIMQSIRDGAAAISTGAGQIAAGNADLSDRTMQSSAALEATASNMDELTSTVGQNSESARQASVLATEASQLAEQGRSVVMGVVSSMAEIQTTSSKVAEILGIIETIAFQTNILALNAAVEAARAGTNGKGFAVVANEVRTLAARTAEAAKEIKTLTAASTEQVKAGSVQVGKAGEVMTEIVSGVERVTQIMAEIATASHEQTTGIANVNRAVASLDQSTQQNAALVEESEAAAASLNDQVHQLNQLVARFKLA